MSKTIDELNLSKIGTVRRIAQWNSYERAEESEVKWNNLGREIQDALQGYEFPEGTGLAAYIGLDSFIDITISHLQGFSDLGDLVERLTVPCGELLKWEDNTVHRWRKFSFQNLRLYAILDLDSKSCKLVQVGEEVFPETVKPVYKFVCKGDPEFDEIEDKDVEHSS